MRSRTTFYWYDYETFGRDRARDRPAQFAGKRTTMTFKDLGGGDVFYARAARDALPDPESVMITGITPQMCEKEGLCESDFAQRVFERLNDPGTVSVGYNSISFDDEFNRFLFWRNFLDPYSHSSRAWKNGCSRWDLLPVMRAAWALLEKEKLQWPTRWDGSPSFRLSDLTRANGIVHKRAHDALSDVEATIGLAALLARRAPAFWRRALENRSKEKVREALDEGPVVWVSVQLGHERAFTTVVKKLFSDGNDAYVWDLAEDPEVLEGLFAYDEIERRFLVPPRDLPEGGRPLPVYKIKTNASPFICASRREIRPGSRASERLDVSAAEAKRRAERLDKLSPGVIEFMQKIVKARRDARGQGEGEPDVDAGLYAAGFVSSHDMALFAKIRRTPPEELSRWTERFDDPKFEELLRRYRARNWPGALEPGELQAWRSLCAARLVDGAHGMRTIGDYREKINELRNRTKDRGEILDALEAWGTMLVQWAKVRERT